MTKDLDKLRAALQAAPPPPEDTRKTADMAAAMAAFDTEQIAPRQGNATPARPFPVRPIWARMATGAKSMLKSTGIRSGLAVTSGALVAGLAVMAVLPPDKAMIPVAGIERRAPAPEPRTAAMPTAVRPQADEQILSDAMTAEVVVAPDAATADAESAAGLPNLAAGSGLTAQVTDPAVPKARHQSAARATMSPNRFGSAEPAQERYANADPNPVRIASEDPVSTFSIDVDTASWSLVRSSLENGVPIRPESVRVEEMVNYFTYDYPAPGPEEAPFSASVSFSPTPWNPATRILRIGLQGATPPEEARRPMSLVFLIDTSGSMQDTNKLPILKASLKMMLGQLRPDDQVAIVTYAGGSELVLDPTPARQDRAIEDAIDRLSAGGSTNGHAGLEDAYALAERAARDGTLSRVILATDGDFNVGPSDAGALTDYVAEKRRSGVYLSVLGFGRGNLNDDVMQALAQNGNGQAAYIDTLVEARKVLVDDLPGTLVPIAQDVKVQVEFNPAQVAEYRLIGYETRALRREDFNNDRVDAGEIGAGHQVTALYEVTPAGSPAVLNTPLRYGTGTPPETDAGNGELAFLRLRYKEPGGSQSRLVELPISSTPTDPDPETRFATAVAGFGQLLRGSDYLEDWTLSDAIRLAETARGIDPNGYRAEAIRLMRLAESTRD